MMNPTTNPTGSTLSLFVDADNGQPRLRIGIFPPYTSKGWEVVVNGNHDSYRATFAEAMVTATAIITASKTVVR